MKVMTRLRSYKKVWDAPMNRPGTDIRLGTDKMPGTVH